MSGTRIGWQLALPILDEIDENLTFRLLTRSLREKNLR